MLTTKTEIANVFKNLSKQKPLDKIAVSEIVGECNLTRQTFYYHFKNISDLVAWIYKNEMIEATHEKKEDTTWRDIFLCICDRAIKNYDFIDCTCKSCYKDNLTKFALYDMYTRIISIIENDNVAQSISGDNKNFIASFYAHAITGMFFDWIKSGMKEKPDVLVSRIDHLMQNSMPYVLTAFSKKSIGG